MTGRAKLGVALAMAAAVGCGEAEEVEVLPLPPLERPSPEARAGLPEVAGTWNFAGWELAEGDSASLERGLSRLGTLAVQTQRLDSLAGFYAAGGARVPVVGEVRRGGVVSLVTMSGSFPGRYLAGRFSRDTLWMQLTSLLEPGTWPSGARVAYLRQPVAEPFVRLRGALPPVAVDSLADSLRVAADSAAMGVPPLGTIVPPGAAGGPTRPARPAGPPPQAPSAGPQPPPRPTPRPQAPPQTAPVPAPPATPPPSPPVTRPTPPPSPPVTRPTPSPEPTPPPAPAPEVTPPPAPEPQLPPLLGVPTDSI